MELPGYEGIHEIQRSGPYAIHRARRHRDGLSVLLKAPWRVPPQDGDADGLERESELLRELSLAGVPKLYELLRGATPCLVLENRGLASLQSAIGSLQGNLRAFFRIAARLCTLLSELHRRDLVSGAVNPRSIFVGAGGEEMQLIDFSLAWRAASETRAPQPASSELPAAYMSPEQTGRINRAVDYRTDFYSLGATLYELLSGAPPFRSTDSLELIHSHIAKIPLPVTVMASGIPEPVSAIVSKLLAKTAEDRYQSALGIRHDLERCEREWTATGAVTMFELAQEDVSDRFLIPQKLYGRAREVEELLQAFEGACQGQTALMLVSGYSGIGKTALINELCRPIIRQRGYFIAGKFDQVVRNIPYGAITQALRSLVWQLLTESEERLTVWRTRLIGALGANGGVLAEVIPEIELIIGKQPAPAPLDPTETQNRFRYVFQSFVGTLAQAEHPLVIFLDDLQWVDAATLELLHALLTGADIHHLLLIGAYRDNEVDAGHLLTWAVGRLEASNADLRRVSLAPLALDELVLFLSDTLHGETSDIDPLARLILQKTDGNPFFVIQFLKTLEQEKLFEFDHERRRWTFRIDAIAGVGMTDNVIDLMTRKIRRLSADAQSALTLAACIGNQFEWHTFLTASRWLPAAAGERLAEALEAGLIQPTSDPYETSEARPSGRVVYSFLHDRVQQAAYGLIPDERKKSVHLDVGRLLLAECGGEAPEDRIFEIVNHLNVGSDLIADPAERRSVARLNLAAGRKAKTSSAYQAASGHFEAGMALLGEHHWTSDSELMFALHLEAAECQYLSGNFDQAERYFRLLLDRATTVLDRAQVHALRIVLYENQSRWAEAVASAREGLELFGIAFPERPEDKQAALDREVDATQQLLGARPIASLVDLPVMTDANMRMVMRTLTSLWAPSYVSGDHLLARLISATMVRLSLSHGNTEDSAYGYVTHAITIGPIRHDYRSAYEWGELALRVNERFNDPKRRAKIHQQFQAHVNLWRRPFETCIPHAREARRSGLESGDFVYAGYGAVTESWSAMLTSRSVDRLVRDYSPTLVLLERFKMTDFFAAQKIILNWALALQGRTYGKLSLSDASFDEQAFIATYETAAPFFLGFLFTARLHLSVMHGEFEQGLEAARRARESTIPGTIWPVLVEFWGGLAAAALYTDASETDRRAYREQIDAAQTLFRDLSDSCPENFRCFWLLLSAELRRIDAQLSDATQLCEEAIAYARQTDSLQHEALASELAARVWLTRGREAIAAALLSDARRCYAAWGASAKVEELERRYPQLLTAEPAVASQDAGEVSKGAAPASLDMTTVLKVSRAIAVEIELEDVLRKVMKIALENAGAQRGVFLQERDGELMVEAEAYADPEQVRIRQSIPLERTQDLPQSVVRYVKRTGQDVVVGNAATDERFAGDPAISRARSKSILCVPVGHQGRLGGILYLENNLTAEAFTPDRIEMMRILAAQAAISLENARLYDDMKSEVGRRTQAEQALRDALSELQVLKNRLETENVYLQDEIRTQHNFNEIVGNSPALLDALHKVERVAPTESTVLILGETGSGKELFARAIHSRSRRNDRPLVKVNCGAIAPGLVESELFGHVKGAFTGAIEKRVGRFEVANGGTIFLDEIGELPLEAQVKLLRVLQEQEFEPVGSSRTLRVNVRVIAATNRNLEHAVREGTFRPDLLYRLNVFPIEVPPLRQRGADVRLLAGFFVTGLARKLGKPIQGFSIRSMDRLMRYTWPGNVRELQNVVERAAILARGPMLDVEGELFDGTPVEEESAARRGADSLEDVQREHILSVLKSTGGVVEGARGAATILGLHPNTLRSRMKKLGITTSPR